MKSISEAGSEMTTHATSSPRRDGGSLHPNTSTVDQILSISWDRQLAKDLAAEIEACTGERRDTVEEMRRFLALKGYRELLQRLLSAREGKTSEEALKAVAHAFSQLRVGTAGAIGGGLPDGGGLSRVARGA